MVTALAMAVPAAARPTDELPSGDELKKVERALAIGRKRRAKLEGKAAIVEGEVSALRRTLIAAAAAVQAHEVTMSRLERRLGMVSLERDVTEKRLLRRRSELATLTAALVRLSRRPADSLVAASFTPIEAQRSAALLGALLPQLRGRAQKLGRELAALGALGKEVARRRGELRDAKGRLQKERRILDRMVSRKTALQRRVASQSASAQRMVTRLATRAESLRELMERIERARLARSAADGARAAIATSRRRGESAAPDAALETRRGNLRLPARGVIVAGFGDRLANGVRSQGLRIATREDARVIAPFEGRVVFAGPFMGYGNLLIIEHRGGYHILLAGLSRIDGTLGQQLLAGEPVGVMGRRQAGNTPTLYVELRRLGKPINPLPWLAAGDRKVSG